MNTTLIALDGVIAAVRAIAMFSVGVFAGLCAVDWAVRTRRISPFNPVARFFRSTVDPVIAPVERRVLRAGGTPAAAPWWALVAAVVAAILLVTLLGFIRSQVIVAAYALNAGPTGLYRMAVSWTIAFLRLALLVRVLTSWFPISPFSWWVRWSYGATEWMLRPLRSVIPLLGAFDITPIVAYFLLGFIGRLLMGL
ncbi:MAG TPA: YggT family protein [Gemmatimonadaceae bacterium]|nr:YggT family protein [Gemmatimonadaceae bacterium]